MRNQSWMPLLLGATLFAGPGPAPLARGACFMGPGGEFTSCDRLVIEGSIEVNLHNCQNMVIAETGLFRGDGSTENADVYGRVEGGLVVRRRLLIRASGHVSGTITYGEIEIEAGGKISGTIQAHDGPKGFGSKFP